MYLGIIDFGFDTFYISGFYGYVVIIAYFIIISICRKQKIHGFEFSLCVLFLYFCFIVSIILILKTSITYPNQMWVFPFLLCVIVETLAYLFKSNKRLLREQYNKLNNRIIKSIESIVLFVKKLILF